LIVEKNVKVIREIENKKKESWRVSRMWSRKVYGQNDLEKQNQNY
jgi:hypothetical protein